MTNSPLTPLRKEDGKLKYNIGNYHLDKAYGGIKLVRMDNESGSIQIISRNGYGTKHELYTWMEAFLTGLESRGE